MYANILLFIIYNIYYKIYYSSDYFTKQYLMQFNTRSIKQVNKNAAILWHHPYRKKLRIEINLVTHS